MGTRTAALRHLLDQAAADRGGLVEEVTQVANLLLTSGAAYASGATRRVTGG